MKTNKEISQNYFAFQSHEDKNQWFVCPKDFWEKHRYIPDYSSQLEIEGFFECMEHTFESKVENPREILKEFGFEILDKPDWYFLDLNNYTRE